MVMIIKIYSLSGMQYSTWVVLKVMPSIDFCGNYNRYREHSNIA